MFGSQFGHIFDKPLASLAKKTTFNPNTITIVGFVLTLVAAFVLAQNLFWGGILILVSGFFDMFDGIVARNRNKSTQFGAFLDSVLDRYSDSFLFLGFAWYFFHTGSLQGVLLSLLTLVGALLISYSRARAEGLGQDCTVGIMERPERILLMAIGAITGWGLPVMWLLVVLTHITVVQRIHYVWKKMNP